MSHTDKRGNKSVLTNKKVMVKYYVDSPVKNAISKKFLFLII